MMQKKLRAALAGLLCALVLALPTLAAEATIRADYVEVVGEGFVADTFCGVDALYNETGPTLFCNELVERFYASVYGVSLFTNNGQMTVTQPSGCEIRLTDAPQPGDIAYASATARERYGNHYAIVKSVDVFEQTVTLFEQNWLWGTKAGIDRVIPYDGGCYDFYTMYTAQGRVAAAVDDGSARVPQDEGAQAPVMTQPVKTVVAWGTGVSNITGSPSAWAKSGVDAADAYGITMRAEGSYQQPITRRTLARLAANTARTLGLTQQIDDPIAAVQQLGLMLPNADGTFDETSTVTRQMAATVLLRLLRQSSVVFDADYSVLARYPDRAAISDWAVEAVAMLTQYELMNGTSKGFEPKANMTLEQCIVLLTCICEF